MTFDGHHYINDAADTVTFSTAPGTVVVHDCECGTTLWWMRLAQASGVLDFWNDPKEFDYDHDT